MLTGFFFFLMCTYSAGFPFVQSHLKNCVSEDKAVPKTLQSFRIEQRLFLLASSASEKTLGNGIPSFQNFIILCFCTDGINFMSPIYIYIYLNILIFLKNKNITGRKYFWDSSIDASSHMWLSLYLNKA